MSMVPMGTVQSLGQGLMSSLALKISRTPAEAKLEDDVVKYVGNVISDQSQQLMRSSLELSNDIEALPDGPFKLACQAALNKHMARLGN